MSKDIKIALFNKYTPKSKVLKNVGDVVLDNICVYHTIKEDLTNGNYELDATIITDDDGIWRNVKEESILKVKSDYGYEIFRVARVRINKWNIEVFARQITIQDQLATQLKDVRATNQNGYSALRWMLENSNEYIENRNYARDLEFSSDIGTINTAYYQDKNLYEALFDCDQSFMNRWGGEIERRGYRTTINKRIGADRGFQIRRGKNLTSFEAETNIDNVITRIKPKAYNGHTIEGYVQSSNTDKYARVKTVVIKYDDVKLQEDCQDGEVGYATLEELQVELIRRATLEFTEKHVDELQATYRINFVDLYNTEEYKKYAMLERCFIGDTVTVYEEKLDINVKVRVIKKTYDVLKQKVVEMELSNVDLAKFKPISITEVIKEINKLPESFENVLSQAKDYATDLINAGINGYVVVNKNEILIMDTPDKNTATKLWRMNINGIAHSSSGYYGQFNTAWTMDGKIVLSELTCEGINALLINAGILKSLNDKTWINMEDGTFNFADTLKLENGKLILMHSNGEEGVSINNGGLEFSTVSETNGMEKVAKLITTSFPQVRDQNGLSICTLDPLGDYIQIGYQRENGSVRGAMYFIPTGVPESFNLPYTLAGIYVKDNIYFNSNARFDAGIYVKSTGTQNHYIFNTENHIGLFGDDGVKLGYYEANIGKARMLIHETPPAGTADHFESWGNWNFKGYTLHNINISNSNLTSTLANTYTRSIAQTTTVEAEERQVRFLFENIELENGQAILNIPRRYSSINNGYVINSIVKKGRGDVWVESEDENRFILNSTEDIRVNVEIIIKLTDINLVTNDIPEITN